MADGTVNYALKYASQVDQRFVTGSLTQGLVNDNFDWIGVSTVRVYSRDLTELNNYSLTGSNRYGTPYELGNAVQEMTLTQDKALTYTIDRRSEQDTMGAMEAAATLAENLDNVVTPAIDQYRLAVIVANAPAAGTHSAKSHIVTSAVSASNAYSIFLDLQEILDNDKAPSGGRVAVVTPKFLNYLKLDENFVKRGDMATQIGLNGLVGEVDGVPVVKVPASYMPAGVDLIITNPVAVPSPIKLQEFKIHTDAPGISGSLCEARFRYDCFVLAKKADAIAVHKNAGVSLDKATASVAAGSTVALTATTVPSGQTVTWSSDKTSVATVSNGTVTGVAAGTANIKAAVTIDGNTYEAVSVVTVTGA